MFIELTEDNLAQQIADNKQVFVQFGAGWCGNCRLLKPKVKRLAEADAETLFIYADAEKFPESRKMATVTNLPTFAFYKNGTFVNQVVTSKEEQLKALYNEATGI